MEDKVIENVIKQAIKKEISDKIDEEIQQKVKDFTKELLTRKDNYIAEVMKGIRITHERDFGSMGINYRIIFENIYKIENK